MTDDDQTALSAALAFLDNYAKGDVAGCVKAVSTSAPILLFGTNDNEVLKGADDVSEAVTRDTSTMTDIVWGEPRNIQVLSAPTLASVLLELPISYRAEGKTVETLFRYALTLGKEGSKWKICGGLASVPFASGTYTFPA
jgi:hypothetical protein